MPVRFTTALLFIVTLAVPGACREAATPSAAARGDPNPHLSSCQPLSGASGAKRLFASGFEGGVSLAAPRDVRFNHGWQDVVGRDSVTDATWPARLWGGSFSIQLLTGGGSPSSTIRNSIETVTGHDGNPTRALHLIVLQKPAEVAQAPLVLQPRQEPGDFYVSQWMRLPANLGQKLGPGGWMTGVPEWKSAGDFRVVTVVEVDGSGTPYWRMKWDTDANGSVPLRTYWTEYNRSVPVPQGEWFHVEFFTHRGSSDGRVWMKVNGRTVFDHTGNNIGVNKAPIDRIFLANPYANRPIDVHVDDIEIWGGVPASACGPVQGRLPAPASVSG